MPLYKKNDIVWVRFPYSDGITWEERPAIVSPNLLTNNNPRLGFTDYILAQLTSRRKNDGLSLLIMDNDIAAGQLPMPKLSEVRVFKLFTINEAQIIEKETEVTREFGDRLTAAIIKVIS